MGNKIANASNTTSFSWSRFDMEVEDEVRNTHEQKYATLLMDTYQKRKHFFKIRPYAVDSDSPWDLMQFQTPVQDGALAQAQKTILHRWENETFLTLNANK